MDKALAALWFSSDLENQKLAIQISKGQKLHLDIDYAIFIAYHDDAGGMAIFLKKTISTRTIEEMYNGTMEAHVRLSNVFTEEWLLDLRMMEDRQDTIAFYVAWNKMDDKNNMVLYNHAIKLQRIIDKRSINIKRLYLEMSVRGTFHSGNETFHFNAEVLNLPIECKVINTTAYELVVYDLNHLSKHTKSLQLQGHQMIFRPDSFDNVNQLEELSIISIERAILGNAKTINSVDFHLEKIGRLPNLENLHIETNFESYSMKHLIPLMERGMDFTIKNNY